MCSNFLHSVGTRPHPAADVVSPPSFSPASLTGLALWLDGADASTLTHAAGFVSQWADKSGGGHHAVQLTGALQPRMDSHSINGRGVLSFDGSDYLRLSSGLHGVPAGANTIIAAYQLKDSVFGMFFAGLSGGVDLWRLHNQGSTLRLAARSGSATGVTPPGPGTLEPAIGGMVRSGASVQSFLGHTGAGLSPSAGADFTATDIRLGASSISAGLNCHIAEFLIFSRALSSAEINQIGAYLSAKWGMVWTDI